MKNIVKVVTRTDGYKVIAMPKTAQGIYLRGVSPDGTVTFRPVVLPGEAVKAPEGK
jgi:hypothetical protein